MACGSVCINLGVQVLTIKPGFVDTPMTREFPKGWLWVQPERVARDIVRAMEKGKDVIYTPRFWRVDYGINKVYTGIYF